MIDLLEELNQALRPFQDLEKAVEMKAYMKGKFAFLGVNAVDRKKVLKPIIQELKHELVQEVLAFCQLLWNQKEREYQQAAVDIINSFAKKLDLDSIVVIEQFITTKSWWDTVDMLASNAVGILNLKYPVEMKKWIERAVVSDNIWLNRTAIIHQLKYKDKLDESLLESCIKPHLNNKEFFLQKAIGWALRQHSRTNAPWVEAFVEKHQLKGLAKREALRLIKN